ncbi:MAG: sirohydrochlorin cobaltochelatase [Ruminococcus sp.]|nr:sirohydrochlorin cobaltochelatase [Ruminococcus sp.]
MKKFTFILCLAMLGSVFTACGDKTSESLADGNSVPESSVSGSSEKSEEKEISEEESEEDSEEESEEEADDEEDYTTGDASLDNVRNQDEIGENELLVISFGTSFNDSRRLTIGAIEDEIEKAFPDYSVRRGFTANIIIDHVQRRDGILIDDVKTALDRAVDNEVKNLVIQPTHLMNGFEYADIVDEVSQYADAFESVTFGEPLLTSDEDFKRVEQAIVGWTAEYDDGKTAICFMGHGTEADSNGVYQKMQDLLTADGYENYFIGTVEAEPTLDDIIEMIQSGEYERVVLEPLMVVCGDHANNDMAGDEEDSWKSVFESAGYKVECIMRGLGENEEIRQIYVDHARTAVESVK